MSFSSNEPLLINQLPISIDLPTDPNRFRETVELYLKRIANVVNTKEGGLYSLQEFSNSELYQVDSTLTTSNVYRKCFNLTDLNGANIPAAGTVSFPHNIVGLSRATRIYVGCTSTTPEYFSVMGYPTIYLTTTNIVFTNPLPGTPLSAALAVCEYLKD